MLEEMEKFDTGIELNAVSGFRLALIPPLLRHLCNLQEIACWLVLLLLGEPSPCPLRRAVHVWVFQMSCLQPWQQHY